MKTINIEKYINKIGEGNVLNVLKKWPDNCIDCVVTSPPYWNLRSYGTNPLIWGGEPNCNHDFGEGIKLSDNLRFRPGKSTTTGNHKKSKIYVFKNKEQSAICKKCGAWLGSLGLEPTPEMYVDHIALIFQEVYRVLKTTGSFWLNIGDSYMGAGGANKHLEYNTIKPKSLCMTPERVAIKLIDIGFILRNVIAWEKPNQMPGSASDRFTGSFEYVYFFVKNQKYYFKQQFEEYIEPMNRWGGEELKAEGESDWDEGTGQTTYRKRNMRPNPKGRNMRTVWRINTQASKIKHYASFPLQLIETPIKAGCPDYVCSVCNQPLNEVYEKPPIPEKYKRYLDGEQGDKKKSGSLIGWTTTSAGQKWRKKNPAVFVGYTDCECGDLTCPNCNHILTKKERKNNFLEVNDDLITGTILCPKCDNGNLVLKNVNVKSGIVFDPFMGSGVTALVAKQLGKNYIGVDLSPEYVKIARERLRE